jgi:hydroxyethylthiazole kinase-like uncharacterized protein yjeF
MAVLQLERLLALGGEIAPEPKPCDVTVDALFGSGINKPLDSKAAELLRVSNAMTGYKIACDIPSGIFADGSGETPFFAHATISMGALKHAYYYDHTKDHCGVIINVDLGLPSERYAGETDCFLLEPSDLRLPLRRLHNSHKGSFGHVAVLEGAMPGAPTMTALAALEFGAGLATIVGYEHHDYPYMLMHSGHIPPGANVLALGMGMGEGYETRDILLMCEKIARVIDADMLSKPLIAELLKQDLPMVITPHPKEFSNLLGVLGLGTFDTDTVVKKKFELAKKFSAAYPDITLVLKGANTLIASNEKIYIASMGTPALAKGGSGDVLAGMIAALIAQGYATRDAAISAVIAHSLAALKTEGADYALTPEKLIRQVGLLAEA